MKRFKISVDNEIFFMDALSEENALWLVREEIERREFNDMANLWRSRTGLPFDVWVESPSKGNVYSHDRRRVKYGNDGNTISVSFWDFPTCEVRSGKVGRAYKVKGMTDGDVTLLRKWIRLNYGLLVELYDGVVDAEYFMSRMLRV